MRVTLGSAMREAEAQLRQTEQELATRARELSSGKRLNALSDDPAASVNAILRRTEVASIDRYVRATNSVETRLAIVDSLLSDIIVQITAAQTAAAGTRGTAVRPEQREAYALQLEGIRDTIRADVSAKFQGAYVFSGAATTTEPYADLGGGSISSYQGDTTDVLLDVDRGMAIRISMNGDELMRGTDPNDLFVELDQLITAIRANDATGIDSGMQALERALDRANGVQSRVGSDLRVVTDQRVRLGARRVEGIKQVSAQEDANLVESVTALQNAEAAYQAALRAIGARLPLSLMNFVR